MQTSECDRAKEGEKNETIETTSVALKFSFTGPACKCSKPTQWWNDSNEETIKAKDEGPKRFAPCLMNTFTKTKIQFKALAKNRVGWYICGPTVYDSAHMGHARNYVNFDCLRRVMQNYFGYDVRFVMNVTDVDDKIIMRAHQRRAEYVVRIAEEVDGVIVPSLPPKTTFPLDDPNSPAIASRATLLREFSAKISLHPLLSRSKALYDFLDCSKSNEKYNKLKLSATKDVKKKTTSALSQIFGSVTNVISSINDSIAKATDVDFVGDGSNLFDVEGALREPISQIEICQYISSLKQRTEKMLASAKKVIKHKEKTTELFADLSTVFNTMQQHEQKGAEIINKISSISKNKTSSSSSASATSSKEGICWRKAAKTFSRIAQIDDTADVSEIKHERNKLFLEKISESLQMCVDVENALAVRKKIVDDYNQTLQSIARNSYRISSLGLPDAGPKREEKRRLELKVADLRVKKTALFQKYEHGRENMETELLWFHTELSKSLGSSLRLFVLTQGAEAGELHRSLLQI